MKIREIVHSPAVTCVASTGLAEAARLLHRFDVGTLVVVDDAGTVRGIITDRDLAIKGLGAQLDAATPVEALMSTSVVTVDVDAEVTDALSKMIAHGVRRLPVTDARQRATGVVALDDLVVFVEREGDMLRRAIAAQMMPTTGGWAGTWDG